MNFSTHKNQIADLIEIALTKDKIESIARFEIILGKCKSLFKTEEFDFWLCQLGLIEPNEIPMTKFGLEEASRSLSSLRNLNRNSFKSSVLDICERIFTYSNAEELCPFQTAYHYYFSLSDNRVFKESEMGHLDANDRDVSLSQVRIAKIGELNVDKSEYI